MSLPSFIQERALGGVGFDLYFAGSSVPDAEQWLIRNNSNRLQSQLNDRPNIKRWCESSNNGKLFIDSGAFSAHTKGKNLDVDEYINYVNTLDDYIHIFAQVDHIPGKFRQPKTPEQLAEAPKLSWDNYLYMKDKVKSKHKLLPIFHQGEDFKWLINMLEFTDSDGHIPYIGISPANDLSTNKKEVFIEKCFNIIEKSSNPNVKTHAFGMTSLNVLERYPFYSADSTSWIMSAAMGNIMTPFGLIYVSERSTKAPEHISNFKTDAQDALNTYLCSIGLSLQEVITNPQSRFICNCIWLTNWMKNYTFKGTGVYKKSLF